MTPSGETTEAARNAVMRELRSHFRPEFLNRVDDIVLFRPLTLAEIEKIVDLQTEDLRKRLTDRGVRLDLSPAARTLVARQGFDPVYGARPLKRYLQHQAAVFDVHVDERAFADLAGDHGAADLRLERATGGS